MARSVSEILDHLGGNKVVSEATRYAYGAVAQWRFKNVIPRRAWPAIVLAFPDAVTLADLAETEARSGEENAARKAGAETGQAAA